MGWDIKAYLALKRPLRISEIGKEKMRIETIVTTTY